MNVIKGIAFWVGAGIAIWIANSYIDAVGWTWFVVTVIVSMVAIGIATAKLADRRRSRAERAELIQLPQRAEQLTNNALEALDRAIQGIEAAETEYEYGRAPLFWDRFAEACEALSGCTTGFKRLEAVAQKYNERSRFHQLRGPAHIDGCPPHAYDEVLARAEHLGRLFQAAIAVHTFAVIYEQRRQTAELVGAQSALRAEIADLASLTARTAEAADRAADSAAQAHGAARRAEQAGRRTQSAVRRATGKGG